MSSRKSVTDGREDQISDILGGGRGGGEQEG